MSSQDVSKSAGKVSAREKAVVTDEAARSIISAEAAQRNLKTARLRQMRLEQEAASAQAPRGRKKQDR